MVISKHQNAGQNHNLLAAVKYLVKTVKNYKTVFMKKLREN
jgi:hypothetical protein